MSIQERIKILTEATPNTWIALSHDESCVVAWGKSYTQAVEKAEDAGESDPILVRVPDDWKPTVLSNEISSPPHARMSSVD